MFVLRIAGDVLGQKRNIEVTFPRRPTLQQICTVAETILPLLGQHDRRPWHPPGPLDGSVPAARSPNTNDVPTHSCRAFFNKGDYVVESLVVVNPATRQWEEVFSAAQLYYGAQVYCFCPLQHHRVIAMQPRKKYAAQFERHDASRATIPASLLATLPVVTEVRDHWVNADRPGAIPEPQQRLVWDCTTMQTNPVDSPSFRRGDDRIFSLSASVDNSRNLSHGMDDTVATAFSARRVPSASQHFTSNSPSAIQPSYLCEERSISGPQLSGKIQKRSEVHSSSLIDYSNLNINDSHFSSGSCVMHPDAPPHSIYFTDPCVFNGNEACIESYRRTGVRAFEPSTARNDSTSYSYLSSAASTLLLSGDGINRYAHLGERLTVLFDVLTHLDSQESGTVRRYLLLRDFYLLSSYVNSSTGTTAAAVRASATGHCIGSAMPPRRFDLTSELASRLGLTWDDVLRSADKDRDGCIGYSEWIAFGIGHPDVVQLLCRGVRRVPQQVSASMARLGLSERDSHSYSRIASHNTSPLPQPDHNLSDNSDSNKLDTAQSSNSFTSASYPCRIHSGRTLSTDVVANLEVCGDNGAFERRCEACRELAAQTPEERLRWAEKPTPFVSTLRQ